MIMMIIKEGGWDSNQSGSSDALAASDPYESDLSSLNNTVLQ